MAMVSHGPAFITDDLHVTSQRTATTSGCQKSQRRSERQSPRHQAVWDLALK